MNAAIRHRGPDDAGAHTDPDSTISIGARRLSIIDVEGGHQPLSNEDGQVWAALNGEIYNHPQLIRHLERRGHRLATRTDTEVLVHLYEEYGDALVHALEGMFAFAIFDARRKRLLLGRDRFGEKPLFYFEWDHELAFASELTALLAGCPANRKLDPRAVDEFFVLGYVAGPRTMVSGVRQLLPGHVLIWERGKPGRAERYWASPRPSATTEAFGDLKAEAHRLLDESVRSRMIADVPVGVFLSGGTDSTLIAALAATHTTQLKTFTVGYDVGNVSETATARSTAQTLGTDHHELILSSNDLAARAPALLASLDQPIADQALVAANAVALHARREVKVVIGGEGADELFGGYPRYRWLERADRLHRVMPSGLGRRGALALRTLPQRARARRLADVLIPQSSPERHLDWVTDQRRGLRLQFYGDRLTAINPNGQVLDVIAHRLREYRDLQLSDRYMRLDQGLWLPDDVLAKADRASMLVSLEVRTPYLQRELAEFAAGLPASTHLAGNGKALLRSVLSDVLGGERDRRAKTAFRVPAADWLRGPLASALTAQVEQGAMFAEGWFDRGAVEPIVRQHLHGQGNWTHVLWPLFAFGLWLDRFRAAGAHG